MKKSIVLFPKKSKNIPNKLVKTLLGLVATPLTFWGLSIPANSQVRFPAPQAPSPTNAYCQLSPAEVAKKDMLRQNALAGSPEAQQAYREIKLEHSRIVGNCRMRTWPRTQAIWLRLYPCDLLSGQLEKIFDDIVNKGYNEVYIESFYDGQVLLPANQNPTQWPSVIRVPGYENVDLLGQAIAKSKERGLRTYGWVFTMNFGYTYSKKPDRENVLARNGKGQRTLDVVADNPNLQDHLGQSHAFHTFVDPYSSIARQDYAVMVNEVLKRKPEGMLFDYVRYFRGLGPDSVADDIKDLWIYGEASQQALLKRAFNQKGQELIKRYLQKGFINNDDLAAADKMFKDQKAPYWQGFVMPSPLASSQPILDQPSLSTQLWKLGVAHASQGVLDFVAEAMQPVSQKGLVGGTVFFSNGNMQIKSGFDSRLQPWDQFPANMERHPMAYGTCGNNNPTCIVEQVQRVVSMSSPNTRIVPAIAGIWGAPITNRPSLEVQMQAIRQAVPQINAISHFSYGWQDSQAENARKTCRLPVVK
jgi:hypothetical protein